MDHGTIRGHCPPLMQIDMASLKLITLERDVHIPLGDGKTNRHRPPFSQAEMAELKLITSCDTSSDESALSVAFT
eukprot:10087756-Karenia_brevis.AAC.1